MRVMQPYYIAIVEDVHQEDGFDEHDAQPVPQQPPPQAFSPQKKKQPNGGSKGGAGAEQACMGCSCTIA